MGDLHTHPSGRAEQGPAAQGLATLSPPYWPSMEALVCAFSELRIREGAGLWGGVTGQMPSCPNWGSKPLGWPQGHAYLGEENVH